MTNAKLIKCPQCQLSQSRDTLVCDSCGWIFAPLNPENASSSVKSNSNSISSSSIITDIHSEQTIAPHSKGLDNAVNDPDATIAPYAQTVQQKNKIQGAASMAHFKIEQALGQGGMGTVYRAKDLELHRNVALKLFHAQTARTDENQPLLDEARLACQLNHPNIVTIYDIARGDDSNFIVMEWVDGETLDKLIPENGFEMILALKYACQIAEGLACAHEHGIIHRDIKPQNIMLNKENRIKILDFGIADLLHQSDAAESFDNLSNDSKLRGLAGTPAYMSPEQISGLSLDQRSDIFSFGILFYQLLSGQRPFKGKSISALQSELKLGNYKPIQQLLPDLPSNLVEIMNKMLAANITQRWQTSAELSDTLNQLYRTLTTKKNWWQKQHRLTKTAIILPLVVTLSWSIKEVIFPPTTTELVERQVAEAAKIALLPFDNISGDPLLQIFSDGLLTTLSSDLTNAGLEQGDGTTWVIPSSEIRRIADVSVKALSDKFGVDLVLTGSVQHMGSTRSIELNLINAKDGRQLKTASLSVDADKLFDGHNRVREAVLKLLGWTVPESLATQFSAQRPQFDGAYKEYIEGNGYLYRLDQAGNLDKALRAFQNAIEIDPKYEDAYVGLAEVSFLKFILTKRNELLIEIETSIKLISELNPSHLRLDYLKAELAMQKGDYQNAINFYHASIEKNQKQVSGYRGLATAYSKLGNTTEAEKIYQLAINTLPNNWVLVFDFGVHYFKNGNYNEALVQFTKLTEMSPNNFYGYRNMAAAYYSLGDIENAIMLTKKSINIRPTKYSYSNLGTMFFYKKQYDNSVEAYLKALELEENDFINWGNLGDAYKLSKNGEYYNAFKKATYLARKALEANPNNTIAISALSYYLANINQKNEAELLAKRIGEQNTGLENFLVATAFDTMNSTEKSLYHLKIALNKNYPVEEIINTPLLVNTRKTKQYEIILEDFANSRKESTMGD